MWFNYNGKDKLSEIFLVFIGILVCFLKIIVFRIVIGLVIKCLYKLEKKNVWVKKWEFFLDFCKVWCLIILYKC